MIKNGGLAFAAGPLPALAFGIGAALLQTMPALPPWWSGAAAAGALIAAMARLPAWRRPAFILLCLAAGFFYAAGRAELRLNTPLLPDDLIWEDITVEGVVNGAPAINNERTRFDFTVERVVAPVTLGLNLKARINDYHRDGAPLPAIADGAKLRFSARLRPPQSSANPHGRDYAGYLFAQNIRLVGYVRARETLAETAPYEAGIRQQLRKRIRASDARQRPLLSALIIGDRGDINGDGWRVLRRTGTAHLVTVSGTHIGMAYLLVAALINLIWRANIRLTRIAPTAQASLILALPAAAAYAYLSGFGVPVQRSLMTMTVAGMVVLYGGVRAIITALAAAMAFVVLINPWAPAGAGFWLSFTLAGVLFYVVTNHQYGRSLWLRALIAPLLVSLLTVPLTLWFFNQASLVSPLANIIAIPVIGFAALPLALAGVIGGDRLWLAAGVVLDYLWGYLEFLSSLSHASWMPAQAPLWLFALALGGGAWILMPRGVPMRFCGALPIIAMLLWTPPPLPEGVLRVTILDVGQASAAVLQTRRHTLVYDAGRAFGGFVVGDYLRGIGAQRIDNLILSHDDYDHRGGGDFVRDNFTIATVTASDGDAQCQSGQRWQWDGVEFTVLHPRVAVAAEGDAENDDSCVLLARAQDGGSALFTGDISAAVERELIPSLPPVNVLHVSHHGSRFSSDAAFLRALAPDIAVISTGRNYYGHPHAKTLRRLRDAGAAVYRTDRDGALLIDLAADADIRRRRDEYRRYWH